MNGLETKVLGKRRRKLLQNLEGQVLEVGAGTGVNFQYYNDSVEVIAVEPDTNMFKIGLTRLPKNKSIGFHQMGMGDSRLREFITPNSLDAIICTLVLCTIPDLDATLQTFKQWLRPDGKLLVMEHIKSKQKARRAFQDVVNPAWKVVAHGCNLNRDTDKLIKAAGFTLQEEQYFNMGMQGYLGVFDCPNK